jgi:hypothetical protein
MRKFVKIEREGMGFYIQPLDKICDSIDGEFFGSESGDRIILELIEMGEGEYKSLPEFTGW